MSHISSVGDSLIFGRVYANGGSCVQVVTSQQSVMVVYGGNIMRMSLVIQRWCSANGCTQAYDIKLLVNKGTVDIVRPQWVLDCVARDELVPLKKRYIVEETPIQFWRLTKFIDTSSTRRTTGGSLLNITNLIAKMKKWVMNYSSHLENKMLA